MGSPSVGSRLGTKFGSYELQELIGMGGMGEVYRAHDTVRDRTVALKLLRPDFASDPSYQDRFRRESRIAARLHEAHIVPVHDFGEIDGVLFIDMRLVEGASVKDELRDKGAMPPARAVSIISQVAKALDAAHANDLVHRDIKPENVLLTPDDFAYLVDFGIAYGGGEASVTKTGLIIGSCAYMATERLSGKAGGPASDVYSLTCLLYECLTNNAPYEFKDLREVMSAHIFAARPRPSVVRRGINPAFDDVVAKGMARDPADRYASAGELARAASAALHGRPALAPAARTSAPQMPMVDPRRTQTGYMPAPPPPTPRRSRMSKGQAALLAGTLSTFALAALLAIVVVFTGGSNNTGPSTPLAAPPPSTTTVTSTVPSTSTPSSTAPSSTPSSTTSTSVPSTSSSTSGAAIAGVSGTDSQGFVDHSARCDAGSTPAAAIRTANSLAIVCETAPGSYYYRGERLSDGAQLQLANAVPAGGGFDAVNPADGARYQVRPDQLTISSSRATESDPALEYGPR